jgi:hypothetical protein
MLTCHDKLQCEITAENPIQLHKNPPRIPVLDTKGIPSYLHHKAELNNIS